MPQLRKRASDETVILGNGVRVRWWDHPKNMMFVEELPGKPFRIKLRRARIDASWWGESLWQHHGVSGGYFMMENLVRDAGIRTGMTYDQAVESMWKAMLKAKAEIVAGGNPAVGDKYFQQTGWSRARVIDEDSVHWLEVEPLDYKPLTVKGKDFTLTSKWDSFSAYSPGSFPEGDPNTYGGDPFYSEIHSQSKGGARRLFKALKAKPDALKDVSWMDLGDWLRKAKIGVEHSHSVWR